MTYMYIEPVSTYMYNVHSTLEQEQVQQNKCNRTVELGQSMSTDQ